MIQLNSLTIQVISFCIKHAMVHQHYGRALKLMMKQQDYPPPPYIDVIQLNSLTIQVISFCIKHALIHQHYGRAILKLMMKQQDYPPPHILM